MDQPPADQELKNIIDKLAQFVARNGPEFEHMTKQKQKDNPKFSFLFGGTYFHYYQYRVTTEQAILKQKLRLEQQQSIVQQVINRQSMQTAPWLQQQQAAQLAQEEHTAQEQIRQSEQNLAAQHQLLLQQQQVQVDEIIRKAQEDKLCKLASENEIDLKELDGILQPIIDSCTKDSISTGKGWIFSHSTSSPRSEAIILYILKRVTEPGATFEAKLHLVYLINDVLHHCFRKNAEDLKKILEKVVVPIFCSTSLGVDSDKQQKLSKLHKLWESNKYFSQEILDQLQNPASSLAAYQASLIAECAPLITPVTNAIQTQYSLLQKQHQDFVAHLTNQLHHLAPHASALMPQAAVAFAPQVAFEQQVSAQVQDPRLLAAQAPPEELPRDVMPEAQLPQAQLLQAQLPEEQEEERDMKPELDDPHMEERMPPRHGGHLPEQFPETGMRGYPPHDYHMDDLPGHHYRHRMAPSHYMDDFSPGYGPLYGGEPPYESLTPPHRGYGHHRPYADMPMGMGPDDMPPDDIPPDYLEPPCQPPYYDLPAGLMVPLVALEDTDYGKPLDPDDVRLPPPALPTERLLAAVEQFYCPPTHERTRNNSYVISSEGWEQLGLYEFFKAKAQMKKEKEDAVPDGAGGRNDEPDRERQEGSEEKSPDSPPEQRQEPEKPKRRYREIKSPEQEVPPPPVKNGEREHRRRSRSASRSRSPSQSPPSSPKRRSSRSPSRSPPRERRSRNRSPKRRSPERRSVSPPSFGEGGSNPHSRRLDESNKGHQLLKKMGWSGAGGLGSQEQGIENPVDAGDVRDRQDLYKGIGVSLNDPYENFRKSKGQAFINRMKARAEELGKT